MTLQTRVFKYDQQDELNQFLQTAHLYHTDAMPALQFKEEGIVVLYKPEPDTIAPFIAAETIYSHIRANREAIVEDDMKIRQFAWRIDEKKARAAEIEPEIAALDQELADLKAPTDAKDKEGRAAYQKERARITKKRQELDAELNGEGKDAGILTQIENAEEDIVVTKKKMEDRRKDIDTGLQFAKEILAGDYKIYKQD